MTFYTGRPREGRLAEKLSCEIRFLVCVVFVFSQLQYESAPGP